MTRYILIGTFVACLTAKVVIGCSCEPTPPPLKAMAAADGVFTGQVTKIQEWVEVQSPLGGKALGNRITMTIAKSLKGDVKREVTIHTGTGGGDCGYSFEVGKSYLVYASRLKHGNWETNICTRTSPLSEIGEEVLELEGRLPKLKDASAPPEITLHGFIDDAGYEGYVFTLKNRLHDRIFYIGTDTRITEVREGGEWVSVPPNTGLSPVADLTRDEVVKGVREWLETYETLEPSDSATYLARNSGAKIFVAAPTLSRTWRFGLQYITEKEFDSGARIQDSKGIAWSPEVKPGDKIRKLTFEQAFSGATIPVTKTKPAEQAGADQPATVPESKPE